MSRERPPMLSGGSIFGHVEEFRHDRLALFRRIASEREEMLRLRFFALTAYLVNSPRLVNEVLVEKARSFRKSSELRYMLYPLAGEGLFTSGGDLWRRQRKLMAPIFSAREIARFADAMVDASVRAVRAWTDGGTIEASEPGGVSTSGSPLGSARSRVTIDIARETTRIAMTIAGRTLFQAETFDEADEIGDALTVSLSWANEQASSLLPIAQSSVRRRLEHAAELAPAAIAERVRDVANRLHGPVLLVGPKARRLSSAVRLLDARVQKMIDERRAGGLSQADLLTRLLTARDDDDTQMTDKQVRDEILTLFVAGHETTASALAWSLDLLTRHPEVAERAQREVDALGGKQPSATDAPRLGYVLRVFKEALRLHPPIYFFTREAAEDVEIGGTLLRRNTVVLVSPYAMHRRTDEWPDPERFDPDRFTTDAEAARPRGAFLPFSAGPRICLGNHFALLEGQLVLSTLLQRARFESLADSGPTKPVPSTTLRPGRMPMRVRLRP